MMILIFRPSHDFEGCNFRRHHLTTYAAFGLSLLFFFLKISNNQCREVMQSIGFVQRLFLADLADFIVSIEEMMIEFYDDVR